MKQQQRYGSRLLHLLFVLSSLCIAICGSDISLAAAPNCNKPILNEGETGFCGCDATSAFSQALRLAKSNDPDALYILGRVYELGPRIFHIHGLKEDVDLAESYYLRAARAGSVKGEETIGWFYWKWHRDTKYADGRYWLCMAEHNSDVEAKIILQNELEYKEIKQSVGNYCQPIIAAGEPTR